MCVNENVCVCVRVCTCECVRMYVCVCVCVLPEWLARDSSSKYYRSVEQKLASLHAAWWGVGT